MELKELELEQIQTALKAGGRDEIKAHLESEGIQLPAKAPWDLPDEIAKFGMKLWQMVNVVPHEVCADGEHDFQLTGKCEMARNEATMPGSCFSREQRCTKCGTLKWVLDKEPAPATEGEGGAEAAGDDRAARRAARKAAREAKAAAAAEGGDAPAAEEAPAAEAAPVAEAASVTQDTLAAQASLATKEVPAAE